MHEATHGLCAYFVACLLYKAVFDTVISQRCLYTDQKSRELFVSI